MTNVVEDLNTITSIPQANISKLFQRVEWLICNAIYEAYISGNDLAEINLGFGKISVLITGNELKYRFQPSRKTEAMLREIFERGYDPIAAEAEKAVVGTTLKAYKDLL